MLLCSSPNFGVLVDLLTWDFSPSPSLDVVARTYAKGIRVLEVDVMDDFDRLAWTLTEASEPAALAAAVPAMKQDDE